MAGWVRDAKTGATLWQTDAGHVLVRNGIGETSAIPVAELHSALSSGDYSPATQQDVQAHVDTAAVDAMSGGEQAYLHARNVAKGAADAATLPLRLGAIGAHGLAHLFGSKEDLITPAEQALSGEALVSKLEHVTGHDVTDDARTFERANPVATVLEQVGGSLVGGGPLSKTAGAVGKAVGGAGRAGKLLSTAIEGAGYGLAGGTEEAWVRNEKLTAEAALANAGLGALLGAGLEGTLQLGKAGASKLAEKVFGRSEPVAVDAALKGGDEAITEMARDVAGVEPPKGFPKQFKEVFTWMRDKAEEAQALATGIPKEDLEKFGALRFSKQATEAQENWINKDARRAAAAEEITDAFRAFREESDKVYNEIRSSGLKRENIAALVDKMEPEKQLIATEAAKQKVADLTKVYEQIQADTAAGGRLGGSKKWMKELRGTFETLTDAVEGKEHPADMAMALDNFKREIGVVEKDAAQTLARGSSPSELAAARYRQQVAAETYENVRQFLQNKDVWGKFGDVQREVNDALTRKIDSQSYLAGKLLERDGTVQEADMFGQPRYIVSYDKVGQYMKGLGTLSTKDLDGKFRSHLAASKEAAEAIVNGYGLEQHAERLGRLQDAFDKINSALERADQNVANTNIIDEMVEKSHASHTFIGHTLSPGAMIPQAIMLRKLAGRVQERIGDAITSAISAKNRIADKLVGTGSRVAPLAARAERAATPHTDAYQATVRAVLRAVASPEDLSNTIASATDGIGHQGTRDHAQIATMNAVQFLASKVPAPPIGRTLAGDGPPVSHTQQAQFMRTVHAVSDPVAVLERISTGRVFPEEMEAVKTVYPTLYQQAQGAVFAAVYNRAKPLPYQTRLRLSELFDVPPAAEPSLDPAFLARVATTATPPKPPAPPRAPKARPQALDLSNPTDHLRL